MTAADYQTRAKNARESIAERPPGTGLLRHVLDWGGRFLYPAGVGAPGSGTGAMLYFEALLAWTGPRLPNCQPATPG